MFGFKNTNIEDQSRVPEVFFFKINKDIEGQSRVAQKCHKHTQTERDSTERERRRTSEREREDDRYIGRTGGQGVGKRVKVGRDFVLHLHFE